MKFRDYWKNSVRILRYILFAKHRRGHGIHSPFVFDFITTVLNDKAENPAFLEIEKLRTNLLGNKEKISYQDPGAGSKIGYRGSRTVSDITRYSATPRKYGELLFRIVEKYTPSTIIELGTSLGIGTLYLSGTGIDAVVYTMEGAEPLIKKANLNFKALQRKNIRLTEGEFDKSLPEVLSTVQSADLVFFDGNHSFDATWKYFSHCLEKSHDNSIFIFDDIHWSDEMEQVWDKIKQSENVKVTIDLFRMGIVFFRKELSKQNFVIKY